MTADRGAVPVRSSARARADVLGRVREALRRGPASAAVGGPSGAGAGPARAYRTEGEHLPGSPGALDLLVDRLTDYRATVVRCAPDGLAAVVAAAIDGASVVVPAGVPDAWLADVTGVVRRDEPASAGGHAELDATKAVLTGCRVAIALTGTIVLDGGPDQGRRALTLLPDRHVCVVHAEQVVHTVPEAVTLLGHGPERPLTWISGPSATSDIELVRVEGVHGPRDLRVVLVTD